MFQATSPFHMFTPIHPAWLHYHDERKLDVTAADLDSIEDNFPAAVEDPLFADYRARSNAGKLHKRRGRKPMRPADYLYLWHARFQIDDRLAEIQEGRRSGARPRRPYEECPIHQAAEEVARRLRYGSGQSLLNRLSRHGVSNKR